jgi:hypothetical protein
MGGDHSRPLLARELHQVRSLPQVVGWRYAPGSSGKPPFCVCEYCTRGDFGAAKLRARFGADTTTREP